MYNIQQPPLIAYMEAKFDVNLAVICRIQFILIMVCVNKIYKQIIMFAN